MLDELADREERSTQPPPRLRARGAPQPDGDLRMRFAGLRRRRRSVNDSFYKAGSADPLFDQLPDVTRRYLRRPGRTELESEGRTGQSLGAEPAPKEPLR